MLYVEADSSGADSWKLEPVVNLLKQGAVGVIPTDTVYVALHLRLLELFEAIFDRVASAVVLFWSSGPYVICFISVVILVIVIWSS